MGREEVAIRFNSVSFEYSRDKKILDEASFAIRPGSKIAIMGQNGAGKSTILNLITGDLKPRGGTIHVSNGLKIAYAKQVIPPKEMELSLTEFFEKCFDEKIYAITPKIDNVLEIVNLHASHEQKIKDFSGGQQARLLLASALIQDPDLLILDEPTNNLDPEGIGHLMTFLMCYEKTCIVISHDADFLNTFTDGVLYLDIYKQKVEQYVGDYYNVVEEIAARVEKEQRKNAQAEKKIRDNKEKINYFANKGGKMRLVARKMKNEVERMEAEKVAIRREDQEIRDFIIPAQDDLMGDLIEISSFTVMQDHKETKKEANISLKKNEHLLLKGPNGIGKSTLLEKLADQHSNGTKIKEGVSVGYYRQDFSTLNFDETVHDSLESVMTIVDEQMLRKIAAGFLIDQKIINAKIGSLSEGQKGLVAFARLVLQKPGLLILDEPTNHINFRHLPIIAKALDEYKGAMIIVSHVPEFIGQIRIEKELDLAN
ncbi:ABC-F family ATP-binding cassette domain-containing protein [bacterium]|jgi:ATPase subunit of ABC transporter with duplicated ATPase domains|nr:ABC-F family ATP-binding cassette domain-containing protein [bacterium]MBT4250952.1 ABC-F family ATP-binding cassette domain-containing protein [bacterium]MBT4597860.1 ABC-F family ATP-binding cassette domain-containing protein [bacterium]MBT6753948.1 ABC-F family ATP-binding cassette domain-containing protein [bacterium]MBT7037377.1 ABC-F family ATP-binding cassette domain-containing protein [bacterium]